MNRYRDLFIENCSNNILQIQALLHQKSISQADISELRRLFHNIKSDAAMMGFPAISKLAQEAENININMGIELQEPRKIALIRTTEIFKRFMDWLQEGKPGAEFAISEKV
jgi:HPt (histidine-containing phosphotransfer) domain-containing protein